MKTISIILFYIFGILAFFLGNIYLFDSSFLFLGIIGILFAFLACYMLYKSKSYIHLLGLMIVLGLIWFYYISTGNSNASKSDFLLKNTTPQNYDIAPIHDIGKYKACSNQIICNGYYTDDLTTLQKGFDANPNYMQLLKLNGEVQKLKEKQGLLGTQKNLKIDKERLLKSVLNHFYNEQQYTGIDNLFIQKKQFDAYSQNFYTDAYDSITKNTPLKVSTKEHTTIGQLLSRKNMYESMFPSKETLEKVKQILENL